MLTGTWCTPELELAVAKGYRVVKIYEVYHFKEKTQYSAETGVGGLFAGYINCWLKVKQEASGWPSWVCSKDDEDRYIREYHQHEGILLDRNAIPPKPERNEGLRYLAKLFLNSFWGKMGQRLSMGQTTFYRSNEIPKLLRAVRDPRKNLKNFKIATEDVLMVEWAHRDEFLPENFNANIFLADMTTTYARVELYKALDRVGSNVLYCDTDSVIYVQKKNSPEIPLGDFLGDFTCELDGGKIVEFVSGGCKQYAYLTADGQKACKIRGFTLNHENGKILNFECMKCMVFGEKKEATIVKERKICRHKAHAVVYNKPEIKRYTVVSNKRSINKADLTTLPFGY